MKIIGNEIRLTRGDDETLTVSVDEKPFVAGDKVELTVREMAGYGEVLIHKTVTEFTDGKAVFHFSPEDTGPLKFGKYSYDCQVTFADIGVKTIIRPSPFVVEVENTYE